jgi:SAM-dependent methyltransferase
MPFAVYLPFFPGHEPNLLFSREAAIDDPAAYFALAEATRSADVFLRELPVLGWILDAGCGGGRWLAWLHRHGRRTVGLDLHAPALSNLQREVPEIPLLQGLVTSLPLRPNSIDGVISLGVVEHAEGGPDEALREFARVLRPGGRLLVSVPYTNPVRRMVMHPLFRRYHAGHAGRADNGSYFVEYRFTREEILAAVQRCGFRPLSCHPHDFLPPRNMGLVSDFNILATRFVRRDGELHLHLPEYRLEGELSGWRGAVARWLPRFSQWLVAAEILVVAEKIGTEA